MSTLTRIPDAAVKGSTHMKRFRDNPESALVQLMEDYPKQPRQPLDVYMRYIADKFVREIFDDERYREALMVYCFSNMSINALRVVSWNILKEQASEPSPAAPPASPKPRQAPTPAQKAAQTAAERAEIDKRLEEASAIVETRACLMLLKFVMPNGKTVEENSGSYLNEHGEAAGDTVGKAIKALGAHLGGKSALAAGTTEVDVREIVRKAGIKLW